MMKPRTFFLPLSFLARTLFIVVLLLLPAEGQFPARASELEGLLSMGLEDLMDVEVTTAFKKPQSVKNIPAAVYVITSEDIRRSGADSIPEILRMVPGVNVAKLDNGNWAVSIRGFNGLFSDKLLVLMDGRVLYDPLFSGVFWDAQDTVLEDIERIEVIRGPGASSWGTNAVNGVINIITKNSRDTMGGMVSGSGGTLNRGTLSARYGFKIGDLGAARFYAKTYKRHQQLQRDGSTAWDDWFMDRAGFRSDLQLGSRDKASLKGEIYTGRGTNKMLGFNKDFTKRIVIKNDVPISGGFIVGDMKHEFRRGLELSLKFYYDHTERKYSNLTSETRDTLNFEFQNRFCRGSYLDFVWGGIYRHTRDHIPISHGAVFGAFFPKKRKDDLFSLFFQNEARFFSERVRFLTGVRLDHYNYSGLEVQPTFRLLYSLGKNQDIWAAISKAVRSPSRYNRDAIWVLGIPPRPFSNLPMVMAYVGDEDFESEKLWAYELGYRWRIDRKLTIDVTGFANFYRNLFSGTLGEPFPHHGYMIMPINPGNYGRGESFGLEFTGNVKPFEWWRMELSYSYLDTHFWIDSAHRQGTEMSARYMDAPHHQVSVRSNMDITPKLEFDVQLRYVANLSRLDVPSYTGLDVRLGYKPMRNLELSLDAKNLLDPYHPEFKDEFLKVINTEVPRSIDGKVTWHF